MEIFNGKKILLISPESWDHLFVSKHNYSIALAKRGNKVFFLNPPSASYGCLKTGYDNICQINYTPFVKGIRFLPGFIQRFLLRRKYKKIETLSATKFDVVWSFDNSVFFDFDFLPYNTLAINHIVDYSQNFQFGKAAATADVCFGVSPNIVARQKIHNSHAYLIGHGIHTNHQFKEVTLPGVNRVKTVYAGNLDSKYLDNEGLDLLIKRYPNVDFIFIGSGGDRITKADNVFLPGRVENVLLLNYIAKADVLLLLYDSKRFPDQLTNAHKVLEYLYSGRVIVSCYLADYADKRHLLQMADDHRSVLEIFDETLRTLPTLNDAKKISERRAYATQYTYEHRLRQIEEIIIGLQRKV